MIEIYHNPRCRKSREGLAIVQASGQEFRTVAYLENVPTKEQLKSVLKKLGMTAEQLLRKNEAVWKENYKGRELSEDEIVEAMISHPKLIERPIVVKGDRAVLGRPPENIKDFLQV